MLEAKAARRVMARAALWLAALAAAQDKDNIRRIVLRPNHARLTPVDYRWHNNRTVTCRSPAEIAAEALAEGRNGSSRVCFPSDVGDRYFTSVVQGGATWFFARTDTTEGTGVLAGAASFVLSAVGPGHALERPRVLIEESDVAHNAAALQWPGSTSVILMGGRSARPGLFDRTHGGVFAHVVKTLRRNPRIRPLFGGRPVLDGGPGIPGCVERHASLPGAEPGWCEFDGRLSLAVFKGRLYVFARANLDPVDHQEVRAVQYTSVDAGDFQGGKRVANFIPLLSRSFPTRFG